VEREDWELEYGRPDRAPAQQPGRLLVEATEGLAPGRALDLACGEGRNAAWLAERGWRVTAVDFSAEALRRARRLGADVDWRQADVREVEIAEGAYDLVVLAYLHLPPDAMQAMLARAAGGVRPGGRLVVIGHHVDNHEHGCGGPSNPAVLHDPEWIGGALDGFQVERADRVAHPSTPEHGGTGTAIDSLVVARKPPGVVADGRQRVGQADAVDPVAGAPPAERPQP
jgi:SAM-dependent methyltransferase